MATTDYKSTPQAKNLLAHLHSMNPGFDIDTLHRQLFDGEALIGTPKPPPDIAPIWNRMNVYDGDTMVIVGFPE